MFTSTNKGSKEQVSSIEADKPKPNKVSKEVDADAFFKSTAGPELVPSFSNQTAPIIGKKKAIMKPGSCPRNVRRRSRQVRNQSKPKNKQNMLNNLGPGTTIIVIQRNEESDGSYSTKQIEDFNGLEEEIAKIKSGQKSHSALHPQYKSENRPRKKPALNNQSFVYNTTQKGKPPLKSPSNQDNRKGSNIPRIGEKRTPVKNKFGTQANRASMKTLSQKSSRVNSIDSEPQNNIKGVKKEIEIGPRSFKYKKQVQQPENKGIEDLIQQKKEALGIKPLESTLSNYKTVLNENHKLQKLVEEQKLKIKKMRQERVEQFKIIEQCKENEKKLKLMLKHETPARSRGNRSGFRNNSRDNSNISAGKKITKSPNYRIGAEYLKPSENPVEEPDQYQLTKSDTVKRLEPKSGQPRQQPKIGGKDHSEVITTELLKKSTQELMQNSFSNYKEIQKISRMEQYTQR